MTTISSASPSRRGLLTVGALALTLALGMSAAAAHGYKFGALEIDHPWTRATPDGAAVAGGFLTVTNTGPQADRLIGGTAAFAGEVEVHEMAMEGDVMKMRHLADGLDIPAGAEVVLKPGGYHIMFMGLTTGLTEGETVKGTLVFEKAGTIEVEWKVEAMGAREPGGKAVHGAESGHDHGAHGHGGPTQ